MEFGWPPPFLVAAEAGSIPLFVSCLYLQVSSVDVVWKCFYYTATDIIEDFLIQITFKQILKL